MACVEELTAKVREALTPSLGLGLFLLLDAFTGVADSFIEMPDSFTDMPDSFTGVPDSFTEASVWVSR